MIIGLCFAVAILASLWVTRRGRVDKRWAQTLLGIWLLNELGVYVLGADARLTIGLWTDFALALIAMFSFTFGRAPWWVLALSLTWIGQIFAHWDMSDDIPTMGLWLNILCAAQIALVCSDRVGNAIGAWIDCVTRTLRYSHGGLAAASRHCTRALGGPDCRAGALRKARRRLEGKA